jgi:hypothetical protein
VAPARRISKGGGDGENKIRRAGATRRVSGHGFLPDPKIRFSHEPCGGFVMNGNGFDLVLSIEQAIEQTENSVAAYPEDVGNLLLD